MKYLHILEQRYKVAPNTYTVIYMMCVSDQRKLEPGSYTITPVQSIAKARQFAAEHGLEFIEPSNIETAVPNQKRPQKAFLIADKVARTASAIAKKEGERLKRERALGPRILDDARKLMGKAPYNEGTNYLVGDGYFAAACRAKYGEGRWSCACDFVREYE